MFTEDQGTGLFSSFKSLFGSSKKSEATTGNIEELVEEYTRPSMEGIEVPATPMHTRTVFFEAKSEERVSKAIHHSSVENLDVSFAENFVAKGGKFMYFETIAEAVSEVKLIAEEMNWMHVYCWENEVKDMFCTNDFQRGAIGFTMENSAAVMCMCDSLIAENGTLLLNPKQASRRRLPVFPKTQIFIANTTQILFSLSEALEKFNVDNKGELPSVLNLQDNCKGNYYYDGQLVLKAEGTEDVYLILVDEIIPPSNRV
ncbi:MAG: LUD domain-containing protein [Chitinophagales bacterium]